MHLQRGFEQLQEPHLIERRKRKLVSMTIQISEVYLSDYSQMTGQQTLCTSDLTSWHLLTQVARPQVSKTRPCHKIRQQTRKEIFVHFGVFFF